MEENYNHLKEEMSPYLKQHAKNPVDWYPWSDEALNKAKMEKKLIFVSIGYSTCHWCHVMERESFSRQDVADLMNKFFVSIKVDREERPDLDSYFIDFAMKSTGSAGWPLNVILTPEQIPVFAFTYLPRESRRGNMGLIETLGSISEIWKENPENIYETSNKNRALNVPSKISTGNQFRRENEFLAYNQMKRMYDPEFGGFGRGMKFPTPHYISFLSNYFLKSKEKDSIMMAEKTVASIRMGGIFDHVGKGLHRYATDTGWKIPHFEKMLYDQASMIYALAQLKRATGKEVYQKMTMEIIKFLEEYMASPDGGFYTAMDADSEGTEGKYYTWTADELRTILEDSFNEFSNLFNVRDDGNYVDEARGISTGRNILYLNNSSSNTERFLGEGEFWLSNEIEVSLERIKNERNKRVPPFTDRKVCGDINGFLLYALGEAYMAMHDENISKIIFRLGQYLKNKHVEDGKVFHLIYPNGQKIEGFLSDYAFISLGLISYSSVYPEDSAIDLVERIMENANLNILKEMEEIRANGFSNFTGNIMSQEDSAMPSQFSAYLRTLSLMKFFGKFMPDQLPVPEDVMRNIDEVPAYFAFRTETDMIEQRAYSIKNMDLDHASLRSLLVKIEGIGFKGKIIPIREGSDKNAYSLCNSNSCLLENRTIDEILKNI
ncbi:thioredoxin domain-containing protein [Cuniculiplasma sp. SKW3]|uniref:thioredoxin domain-containing protein n=1 Tax=Cuniculiplasma sp. SKW3 TaxID=3400170 RepID=UPI003FD6AB5E